LRGWRQGVVQPARRSGPRHGLRGGDRRPEPDGDRELSARHATIAALQQFLQDLEREPVGMLVAATDCDNAGRRYATKLQEIAMLARVRFDAILPPNGLNDWNDALRANVSVS
jgi:Toprim-like